MLAHRKTIYFPDSEHADDDGFIPGIFTAFRPERIEYIVTGKESQEELDRMEERGITLIDLVKIDEPLKLEL